MVDTIFAGITTSRVETPRLTANVLARASDAAADDSTPTVLFVHGNVSSSLFWQPLMLALPDDVRALAVDLRGYGDSETLPVDATRGVRDWSDDVASVIDTLDLGAVHLVGWSLGGGVTMQLLLDRPDLPSSGGGETPIVAVAPAIANAIRAATGRRLHALPLAPKGTLV